MVVVVVVTLNFNDPLEDNLLGAIDTGENGDVVRIKCVLHFLGKIGDGERVVGLGARLRLVLLVKPLLRGMAESRSLATSQL